MSHFIFSHIQVSIIRLGHV